MILIHLNFPSSFSDMPVKVMSGKSRCACGMYHVLAHAFVLATGPKRQKHRENKPLVNLPQNKTANQGQ